VAWSRGAGAQSASGALNELRCSGGTVPDAANVAITMTRSGACAYAWERESERA
jgi:hypothetical protein